MRALRNTALSPDWPITGPTQAPCESNEWPMGGRNNNAIGLKSNHKMLLSVDSICEVCSAAPNPPCVRRRAGVFWLRRTRRFLIIKITSVFTADQYLLAVRSPLGKEGGAVVGECVDLMCLKCTFAAYAMNTIKNRGEAGGKQRVTATVDVSTSHS